MTRTTWTPAPAGMLGQGIAGVLPYPGVVGDSSARFAGRTGSPIGGFPAGVRGTTREGIARLRPLTSAVLTRTNAPAAQEFVAQQSTQIDNPTSGIHSPGRPQS